MQSAAEKVKQGADDHLRRSPPRARGLTAPPEVSWPGPGEATGSADQGGQPPPRHREALAPGANALARDLTDLLTVILGQGAFLLSHLEQQDPLHEPAAALYRASSQAASLLRALLAGAPTTGAAPAPLHLNHFLQDRLETLRGLLRPGVTLTTVLEPGLGLARADSGALEQVLMRLVHDAQEALPGGGEITLRTANAAADPRLATPGAFVLLAVSDTRSERTPRSPPALVEALGQRHGGSIQVVSTPGYGATVLVAFPRIQEEGTATMTNGSPVTTEPPGTVLVVEDHFGVRSLARTVLCRAGYKVLEARDGKEALALCHQQPEPIQLLLTDMILPEMSGLELAQRIAAVRPDVKVLYMSGYTAEEFGEPAEGSARQPFLQKPFSPDQLLHKVREVLQGGDPQR